MSCLLGHPLDVNLCPLKLIVQENDHPIASLLVPLTNLHICPDAEVQLGRIFTYLLRCLGTTKNKDLV